VIKAARVLPRLSSSDDCLGECERLWQELVSLYTAVEKCSDDSAVVKQLLLRSQLLRQLFKSLSRMLQQLASDPSTAAAAAALGPAAPALALVSELASCAALLVSRNLALGDIECNTKLVAALRESGKQYVEQRHRPQLESRSSPRRYRLSAGPLHY
jgi:hypothetical protein